MPYENPAKIREKLRSADAKRNFDKLTALCGSAWYVDLETPEGPVCLSPPIEIKKSARDTDPKTVDMTGATYEDAVNKVFNKVIAKASRPGSLVIQSVARGNRKAFTYDSDKNKFTLFSL